LILSSFKLDRIYRIFRIFFPFPEEREKGESAGAEKGNFKSWVIASANRQGKKQLSVIG